MGFLIGFASTQGGCLYYRCELPARELRAQGLDVVVGSDIFFDPDDPRLAIATAPESETGSYSPDGWVIPDTIVLAGGWPRIGPDMIRAARAAGQRVICDCDDWPWLPTGNPHHVLGGGDHKISVMRAADHVTVSTPALLDLMRRKGIAATLCRNSIDLDVWSNVRDENVHGRTYQGGQRVMVVGYRGMLGGFHDGDVRSLAGGLPLDFEYVHVGADPRELKSFAKLAQLPPDKVERRQAVAFEEYNGVALAGVDVAVVPYCDRPFSLAKSNIACMEWTAAGVPWIASNNTEAAHLDPAAMVYSSEWDHVLEDFRDVAFRDAYRVRQWRRLERWLEPDRAAPWARVILETVPAAT